MKVFFLMGVLGLLVASPALAAQDEKEDKPVVTETKSHDWKSLSDGKWFLSLDVGTAVPLPGGNLSSYGVHYRGQYNAGLSVGANLFYQIWQGMLAGVKCDVSSFSANYALSETLVADDLGLLYVAPQLGERFVLGKNKRMYVDWIIGAGYMHYRSESLLGTVEREATKGFFGYNMDVSLNYRIGKSYVVGCFMSWVGGKASSVDEKMGGNKQKLALEKKNKLNANLLNFSVSVTAFW